MGQTSRTAAFTVALSALVALAGCSSGSSTASGSSTVSVSPGTQWAGSVCSSAQNLEQSLKDLTGKLTISANSSQSSLSQAKQQLLKRVNEVEAAASGLASTLQNPPASADQQVKTAQQQLKAASDRSQQALQQLTSATTQLQSAGSPAEFTKDAVTVGAAVAGAASDVGSLLSSLEQYASSTHTSIKNAFGDAPSCQALSNSE